MKKIIIVIILIIICALLYVLYQTVYLDYKSDIVLDLNGNDLHIEVFNDYIEEGAVASFRKINLTDKIKTTTNLDTNKVGEYIVTYKVSYKKKTKEITRKVYVVDNIKPTIELKGEEEISIYKGNSYNEPGYVATDNYDGDITDKVEIESTLDNNTIGEYIITYNIADTSNNKNSITRKVIVKEKPVSSPGIAVLNYHFFYDDKIEGCDLGNCISTTKFEQQLKYLNDNGYKTLTIEEFRAWMYGEIEIPKKSVLITIDDGALGTGLHNGNKLIPLLEKYQVHATLFLITGWWSIENYRSPYLDIESHTHDMHTEGYCTGVSRGAKMLCLSHDEVINDLKASISVTGSTTAFCYPFFVYNETAINELKEVGFKLGFAGGGYKATRNSNKFAIPRYQIYQNITMDSFINYIS